MSYVLTSPQLMTTAAADLEAVDASIGAAQAAAAGSTSGVVAAGRDEVSAAVAAVFGAYGRAYRRAVEEAAAFHAEFTRALAAAGNAYAHAEAANAALLSGQTPIGSAAAPPLTALIMGGTGNSAPAPGYIGSVNTSYIQTLFPGAIPQGLFTPEQFWPFTFGLGDLKIGQSVAAGVPLLDSAIRAQLGAGNDVVVFGYSQSAAVATDEIRALAALPAALRPDPSRLSFVLTADPNNPDGGLLERFPGFYLPFLDMSFNGATPPNSPFPTSIYTSQYDGIADAPQYPFNFLTDLNAFMGDLYAHDYAGFTPTQIATAQPLPVSPGYTGDTHYYMVLTQHLPLLAPIRGIPFVGPPIADLVQPDLRVLVDLGYGNYGPGGDYANVPTPARLFQVIDPFTVGADLAIGAVQGPQAALVDVGLLPPSCLPDAYPYLPSADPGLSLNLGQPSVTGLSLLSGALGSIFRLIPPGPYC
ncbi:PE family protein [Mycobacterium sp. HUMS_1102779]|uniref:PE family protein n=1 Tax=Mycobacterium sp. HUMS_1102779 TaxID=3383487 RepID=UPI00389A0859